MPDASKHQVKPLPDVLLAETFAPQLRSQRPNAFVRRLCAIAIIVVGAVTPAWLSVLPAHQPQTRDIHIEAYRYGFSPSRIHVNRGDRLRLTFSTRDTGQSFFLQDYDLHVTITPGNKLVAVQRLSHPDVAPQFMETVEVVAALPGWRGWLTSKSTFRNHIYNGPLHGTERGDLIVSPNILLNASLGLLCAIPFASWILLGIPRRAQRRPLNLFDLFPRAKRVVKAPSFQFNLALPMLAIFWFVILAGLFGTKVSGRNAGSMTIWVVWLSALILVLVPIGGRIWCMACPVPILGEWLQRRRRLREQPPMLQWPSWLANTWPRTLLFLLLGTFSTTLVALPPAASWVLISFIVLDVIASFFAEERIFCRYLCPISTYITLYSATGRVMVRSVDGDTCDNCKHQFCRTGSVKGWGCPYGLTTGELDRNNDCGLCMECVKTCAYDNVSVFWRSSGWDRKVATYGEAWQAIVMFALGCLYCIVNLGAWDGVRNWIDLIDKHNWAAFSIYSVAVWTICLAALPLLWYLLTATGSALGRFAVDVKSQFRRTTSVLIPIGMACWVAFALTTVFSMTTFVLQSWSDPFNWGWDLFGMAGSPWHIVWSAGTPWLQAACIVVGAVYSLRTLYRTWADAAPQAGGAIAGLVPQACFVWTVAAGMIWFFAG